MSSAERLPLHPPQRPRPQPGAADECVRTRSVAAGLAGQRLRRVRAATVDPAAHLPARQRWPPPARPGWRPLLSTTPAATRTCPDCANDPHRQGFTLASGLPLQLSCPTHHCYLGPCFVYPDHLYWDTAEPCPRPAPAAVTTLDGYTEQALNGRAVSLPRRTVHSGMWFRLLCTLLDELCVPSHRTGPVVRSRSVLTSE